MARCARVTATQWSPEMNDQLQDKVRAKRLIVEIICQAGGEFHNKTNLFKAFWMAHLCYAKDIPDYLSFWPIVKMPKGPEIHDFDTLIGELIADGVLEIDEVERGEFSGFIFTLTEKDGSVEALPDNEISAILEGVKFVKGKTATNVSDDSHELSRSWNSASFGEELNIYVDLLSETEYQSKMDKLRHLTEIAATQS